MALINPFKLPSMLDAVTNGTIDPAVLRGAYQNSQPAWNSPASTVDNEHFRYRLVMMRLRRREGETHPYQHFSTALAGDKVFIFVVQDNQAVVLDDNAAMFPSDTLITQLRLLEK